jgi:hypothetical protein
MVNSMDYTTISLVIESWEALKRTKNYEETVSTVKDETYQTSSLDHRKLRRRRVWWGRNQQQRRRRQEAT